MKRFGMMILCQTFLITTIAADVTVGLPAFQGNAFCWPFSCGYSGEYQQVYTAGQFPGTINIVGLEFFNTALDTNVLTTNHGNWTISLSTTQVDWNTITPDFAANLGPDNTQVFSGDLFQPWAFGDSMIIPFSAPFTYNPSRGNLLMDVNATGDFGFAGALFFDMSVGDTTMGTVTQDLAENDTVPLLRPGFGLVTDFLTEPTPEPTLLIPLALGVLGLGYEKRRRSRRHIRLS